MKLFKDCCDSSDAKKCNVNAWCSWGDISIPNYEVHFMLIPSIRDNSWLNRSGDILRYLYNCPRSSFNSWNKVLNAPETESHVRHKNGIFVFLFSMPAFLIFESRKYNFSLKNSCSVHNCFEKSSHISFEFTLSGLRKDAYNMPIENTIG